MKREKTGLRIKGKGAEAIADFGSRNADWENRWTNKEEAKQEGELSS